MEVISPSHPSDRPGLAPMVAGTVLGTMLVVGGLTLAYAAFATPLLTLVLPSGRPAATDMAVGMAVWAFALVAPAGFILVGTNRLARILGSARRRMPRRSPTVQALASLPDGVVVATGLTLPDGRSVTDVVVGPFGAVVIRELPPADLTRIHNGQWQARTRRGWIALDNPLDRTVRDAERVRRWLGHDDADFVVKVHAAVVSPQPMVARTASCAVLTPDQLAPWIAALPPQRSLTEGRRQRLMDMVRAAAV